MMKIRKDKLFGEEELKWLRFWFGVHFAVDMLVAVPLMLAPRQVMNLLGLEGSVVLVRVIAAALLGIGGESFFGRNGSKESLVGMLRLKIIWSSMAVLALGWGLVEKELSLELGGSLLLVFLVFNLLWVRWYFKLKDLFLETLKTD